MANVKISELTAKGAILESTDLLIISDYNGSTYDTKSATGANVKDFVTNIPFNTVTTDYTLVLTDKDKIVEVNSASAKNITIPPNASVAFPIGTQILICNYGAGLPSLVAGSGVTIRSKSGNLKLSAQYSAATIIKRDTNEWYLIGDLTA